MKKKMIGYLTLVTVWCSILLPKPLVYAQESSPSFGFDAQAQIPEKQIDSKVSYFHVGAQPNEVFDLIVTLTNATDKEIHLIPGIYRAKTNIAGTVEYTKKTTKLEAGAQENIEEIATIQEDEIILPARGTYDCKIHVQMPEKAYTGIQAGAIRFLKKNTEQPKGNVNNQFAREIGLILESSNPEKLPTKLNLPKVQAGQMNGRNAALVEIENNQPKFVSLKNVTGKIQKKGKQKIIAQGTQSEVTIAPNTRFSLPISIPVFEAGTYVARITAKEGAKKWTFEKEFTITKEKSKQYNQTDVSLKSKLSFFEKYKWMIITIFSLIVIDLFLFLVWIHLKKKTNP
ncbi:DUF916 and DUF3324 domain-containing protein [Enterococcus hirae]|nr:DUF916 and DUF3324 domain-containing protein [Enterococcus hirae]MCH1976540.1 DUF916 and DUF3324 domain-containing protein [Enterococcus hirae]